MTDYASLIEAIETAQAGETITLTQEITSNEIIVINKAITLDGNGKTLTSTAGRAINVSGADGVTIKNLIIECSGERAINVIQKATNVTIDNVIATASNYTVNVATSAGATKVSINESTLNGLCTVNVAAPGADVTITESTVNCNDNNTTVGESYAAICLNKDATNGKITVTGSTINVTDGSDSMKARNSAEGGVITIDGSSDDVLTMVAIIDYPEYNVYHSFATLAGAIEFATEGQTVTLIRDINLTEGVTVPADATITIDLNGKTISQTKAQTAGYQVILNDGNLTINDSSEDKTGKISYTDSGNGGEYISDVIYNRATLVINGGTIENLSSATVASNGYPHAVDTYSGIRNTSVTINGGTIYCAEYSAVRMFCVSATYNADLVINGGTIKGAIDMQNGTKVLANGTLTINGGTFETTKNVNNIRFANWNSGATEYGISAEIKNGSFNGGITTAYVPAAANWNKGIISGGTFTKDLSEYCADGYAMEVNEDGTYGVVETTAVAQIGETKYGSLQEAENAAQDDETIVLLEDIVLDGMVTFFNSASERMLTLDMNGKTIKLCDNWDNTTAKSAFWVCDGLTITGNGTINANPNGENNTWAYAIIVGHRNAGTTEGYSGSLVIENGTFYGDNSSVISVTNGTATINGGTFESAGYMDLNCIDDMYAADKANITVKGGTFKGFNPENNACEGANTNFCAEGYAALPDLNGNYVVGAKPTATVNNLGRTTVAAGDYTVYGNGDNTADMPLSFVMQFLADQDEEDMANSPYADWYGDFVITFTGIENGSFTADGCYLAGYYGSFGWVKIPVDGMTIEEDARYPVMLGVGMGQKYDYICSSVQDFKCALYLTPEILEANPNIQVNLELAIVDNSQGEDAAVSALEKNENVYSVTDYDYDAIDFNTEYVARIENVGYETLEAAINKASNDPNATVVLLKNTKGSGVVIDGNVTIDFGGFTYTFTSPAVGSTGTTSNGFQILNGNTVTLQNGTLNVAEANKNDYYMLIQNYANLTVEGMTLDGTYLDKWVADYEDSYVLSNNSGNVNIINSTITANNDGTKSFAFDACKYANYEVPVVTLDAASKINGKVELSGGELKSAQAVTATVKKDIVAYSDENEDQELEAGWYTISFPFTFTDETSHNLVNDNNYDLYRYDEPTAYWINHKATENNTFGNITLGNGYLYAHKDGKTIEATGNINVENTTVKLTTLYEGNLKGFNLIGNPFTYNITTDHFSGVTLAEGYYTLSNHGAWTAVENGVIAPLQGVLVKTTTEGDLTISKTSDTKRGESEDNGSIKINVSNENYSDVAYVSFNEGIGLDKIDHRNANVPMVYIPVDGVNYAIATMSQDVTEIPVSFRAMTMGEYTISVEAQNCEFAMMTLIDRLTGIETNLLIEDYTFIATTKENADRFCIRLDNSQQTTDNSRFAYINNGMLNVDVEGYGMLNVYDVTGRSVAEYNVFESANISTSDFVSGMYIIRMSDENGIKVQKIVIE